MEIHKNMTTKTKIFLALFFSFAFSAVAPSSTFAADATFNWAKRIGGAVRDDGISISTDTDGNMYLWSIVTGTADLNGNGTTTDSLETSASPYGGVDPVLIKMDANQNVLWYKRFGGSTNEYNSANISIRNDKIIVIGWISGVADINGDGDTSDYQEASTTAPFGGYDGFATLLDLDGNTIWQKRLGGTGDDLVLAVAFDGNGDIYLGGNRSPTADMNGDGDTTDPGETSASPYGGVADVFVVKLDGNNGEIIMSKRFGGGGNDSLKTIAMNSDGTRFLVTGLTQGVADFNGDGDTLDTGEASSTAPYGGDYDSFISVFDESWNGLWTGRVGGEGNDSNPSWGVFDHDGNIYITQTLRPDGLAVDINGDGDTLDENESADNAYAYSDYFLEKWTTEGEILWSKKFGGMGYDISQDLILDSRNNVTITGYVGESSGDGSADLNGDGDRIDEGETSADAYSATGGDIFLTTFDEDGNFLWGKRFGGAGYDTGTALTIDQDNNILVIGTITNTADLNGDRDTTDSFETVASPYGGRDIFFSSWTPDYTAPTAPTLETSPERTHDNQVTISGIAESGATVTITGGSNTASGTSDGSFSLSVTLTRDTANNLSVTATDWAGNVSPASGVTINHISPGAVGVAFLTPTFSGYSAPIQPIQPVIPPIPPTPPKTLSELITELQALLREAKSQGITLPQGSEAFLPSVSVAISFTRTLRYGMEHNEVLLLQQKLNALGYIISTTGPGSIGNESTCFGTKTKIALQKFQCEKMNICSGTPTTTGYGLFGPMTREALGKY
jgi:hypothetical protein